MLPNAYISHITARRLRIKIPSKKGDISYFDFVKRKFSELDGVEKVEVNPLIGSVLILHTVDSNLIAEYARANNLFNLSTKPHKPSNFLQRVSETFGALDNQIKKFSGGELDSVSIAFLSLLGAGIYQLWKGNISPIPWYAAFWYAFNIFFKSKAR